MIDDPKNSLYREFVRVLSATTPKGVVMENVTGMEQMGVREQIAEDLALEGEYRVRSQVVDAADFGVPQTRKRLLFIGCHRALNLEPPILQGSGATSALALARRNGARPVHYEIEYLSRYGRETWLLSSKILGISGSPQSHRQFRPARFADGQSTRCDKLRRFAAPGIGLPSPHAARRGE